MTTISYFALIYATTLWFSQFLLKYLKPEMFMDFPDERKLHNTAKPRFGGIAFGVAIIVIGWFVLNHNMQYTWYFLAAIAMFILGAIDDYWSISWRVKLPTQLMSGLLVVVQFVNQMPEISFFGISLGSNPIIIGALFIFWFVGIVNAVNLIDGMDGLAGGYVFLTTFFALVIGWLSGNSVFIYFNAIFMGAMAAFLHFNQRPAKFFMGDSGSLLLGFHVAVLPLLYFYSKPTAITSLDMTPFLILCSYLIVDTARVFYDRLQRRMHPLEPDQNHLHHLLYQQTGSYKGTLLTIFVYLSIFGILAVLSTLTTPGLYAMIGYLLLIMTLIFINRITDFGLDVAHRIINRFSWDEEHLPGYQMFVRIRFLPLLSLIYFASILTMAFRVGDIEAAGSVLTLSVLLILLFSARGAIFPHNAEIMLIAVGMMQVYFLLGVQMVASDFSGSDLGVVLNLVRIITLALITIITLVNYIARSKSLGPDFWKISDLLILFILVGMASIQTLGIGIPVTMAAELGILYLANKLGLPRILNVLAMNSSQKDVTELSPQQSHT